MYVVEDYVFEDWIKRVNKPCPGVEKRRCLGNQPDVCIFSECKFHIIIISRKDVIQWQTQNRHALRNYIFP